FAPDGLRNVLQVLSAAVALTDDLARALLADMETGGVSTASIIECLRDCDFVAETEDEWRFEKEARRHLLSRLETDPDLTKKAHAILRTLAADPPPDIRLPAYLTWRLGLAYHTAVFDAREALELYLASYSPENTGKGWLLGILAEEQQKSGWLPAAAIEPAFFRGMSLYKEGRWEEAEGFLIRVSRSEEPRKEVAEALYFLGAIAEKQRGDVKAAEQHLAKSLKLFEQIRDASRRDQVEHALHRLSLSDEQAVEEQLSIPGEFTDVWEALSPDTREKVLVLSGSEDVEAWKSFWQTLIFSPRPTPFTPQKWQNG
ncbi:MAG: tetratricopeptide repeat protein, partial [Desulfobacterales bacterium]|nr:tetratricopeptide repeat protein [Desulfobacterales bacterium]